MAAEATDPPIVFDTAAAEVRGLRLGLRSAWRLRLRQPEVEQFRRAARDHGLHLAVSDHPWTAQSGGQLAPRALSNGQVAHLAVVAGDPAVAQQCLDWESELHRLDSRGDPRSAVARMVAVHQAIGRAYGYPTCCTEAFCDAFVEVVATERAGDNPVAVARAAWRSLRFDPLLDTLTSELGEPNATPLRHLPCRFDCQASLDLAGRLAPAALAVAARTVVVLATGEVIVCAGGAQFDEDGSVALLVAGGVRTRAKTSRSTQARSGAASRLAKSRACDPPGDQPANVENRIGFSRALMVHGNTAFAHRLRQLLGPGLTGLWASPGVGLSVARGGGQPTLVGAPTGAAATLLPAVLPFGARRPADNARR